MKLVCRWCGKTENRDMRLLMNKAQMYKRGYRSYCENFGKTVYLVPVKKKK